MSAFIETVEDGRLSFDLFCLPRAGTIGVARTLTTRFGVFEQHLVFDHREEFFIWIDNDDYRQKAQALFVRVLRRFDQLMASMEEHRDMEAGHGGQSRT